jgi:hypothetical protein
MKKIARKLTPIHDLWKARSAFLGASVKVQRLLPEAVEVCRDPPTHEKKGTTE